MQKDDFEIYDTAFDAWVSLNSIDDIKENSPAAIRHTGTPLPARKCSYKTSARADL